MGVFNALFGAASLPTSLREGMADYNLVKCYVLLHDLTTGPANSQAATDGLQVAAGLQRPPLWIALRRTHAMRAPCSPRGVGAPNRRPPPTARPPPPTARPPRPPLPPLSIAAPALHRCPCSPSLPPLSIAAASFHLPQEISRAYGPEACKLLPVNSRAAGAPPLPDLWTGARPPEINPSADAPPPPAAEELGALLSDADMEQARTPAPDPDPGPRRSTLTRMLDPSPDPGPGPGPEPYPRARSRPRTRARPGAEQVRKLVAGPLAKLALGHLQQRVVQISATVKASRQGVKNMVRAARAVGGRAPHCTPRVCARGGACGDAGSCAWSCAGAP